MRVGDLVMWIGKDSDHGAIGMIAYCYSDDNDHPACIFWFDVMWGDGTLGTELHHTELMVLDNAPEV